MRTATVPIAFGLLLLSACGKETLTLPADPVDRAATCGVVAAAEARLATPDIKDALSFAAQGRIMHYAILAGSAGEEFSAETASRVSVRMSELQEDITKGKWKELAPACQSAYPAAAKADASLPADLFEARLGCDSLAEFLVDALGDQAVEYGNELSEYRALRQDLEAQLTSGLRARAGSNLEAQQAERRKAVAVMAKAGPPTALLKQCIDRFGGDK